MSDLATLTAILYGARLQRRIPESDAERRATIAAAMTDAKWIISAVEAENIFVPPPRSPLSPSPGALGRTIADVKETRRRG